MRSLSSRISARWLRRRQQQVEQFFQGSDRQPQPACRVHVQPIDRRRHAQKYDYQDEFGQAEVPVLSVCLAASAPLGIGRSMLSTSRVMAIAITPSLKPSTLVNSSLPRG